MKLEDFRLCVREGRGLVARFPKAVLVVTGSDWSGMPATDRLLEECRAEIADFPLPLRLAALVEDAGPQKVPSFCAIADDGGDDRLAMFVHGDSQVLITGAQPVMRVSGGGRAGWTGGVHDQVASLIIGPAGESPEVAVTDDRTDLRYGVVPGGSILLIPNEEPMPAQAAVACPGDRTVPPLPPTEADQPGDPLTGGAGSVPEANPVPAAAVVSPALPTFDAVAAAEDRSPVSVVPPAAVDGAPVMVWGIHCKRGHFNHPDARYCRMCGTHMVHQRRDPVLGPRPVLGFLVLDDGSTYKLDADYVIGSDPDDHDAVRSGDSRGLRLSDPQDSVSAAHAALRIDKWDVFV
ncbi:MAG: hypothetical protein QOJ52_4299, partial [Acidimicrobiaceae bacterium]|nr:hypothetical protein [Acidimicrobiaceae bacterium]